MIIDSKVIRRISLPLLLISLPLTVMSVLLPLFTSELGLNPIQITGLFSVFSLGLVIVRLITGHIADKVGRKPIFVIGILFYIFSYFTYSKAITIPLIYLARSLQSIAAVFVSISTYSMIADLNNKNNAHNFGKLSSYSDKGGLLGIALCFVLLNNSKLVVGWTNLFITCTAAAIFAGLYSIFNVKETKSVNNSSVNILLPPDKFKIMFFNFVTRIFTSVVSSIFVLYLQAKFDSNLLEIAFAFLLPTILIAFASPRIGTISDDIGAKMAIIISLGMLFISMLIIPHMSNIYLYGIIWTMYCVAITMLDVTINGLFIKDISEEIRGTAIGRLTTAANIGNIIGPILGGLAFQRIGLEAPFYISSFGFIILFLFSIKYLTFLRNKVS